MNKKINCLIILSLLLSSALLIMPTSANDPAYEDISPSQANHKIKHTENVVILDVRNESEFELGHLYNAQLIPLGQLENKTRPLNLPMPSANDTVALDIYNRITSDFNLSAHTNDPIIVYCQGGSRSSIACQLLVDNGFTEVYNMIGGIKAWMTAEFPIYTKNHYVTVDLQQDPMYDIQPFLKFQSNCNSCQTQTCLNSVPSTIIYANNLTSFEILDNSTEHYAFSYSYIDNGNLTTITVNQTQLWHYESFDAGCNRTANLDGINMTVISDALSEPINSQSYNFVYYATSDNYKVALRTNLQYPDNESYGSAYTAYGYAPVNKTGVLSQETVVFNSSATLSEYYLALGKVSKALSKIYEKSCSDELTSLSDGYATMDDEAKILSHLVAQNLSTYDKTILNCTANLLDSACTDLCGYACGTVAGLACASLCAGIAAPCWAGGPLAYAGCYGACFMGCSGGLSGLFCTWLCNLLCGEEASVEEYGCSMVCSGMVCAFCPDEAGFLCWTCDQVCNQLCQDVWPDQPEPPPMPDAWADYISWTEVYPSGGTGYLEYWWNILDEYDDNYAHLYSGDYGGDVVRVAAELSSTATGQIVIRGYANNYDAHLYVFTSEDGSSWTQTADEYISPSSPQWINGGYAVEANYIMVCALNDYYYPSDLYLDAVAIDFTAPPPGVTYWADDVSWTETYGAGSSIANADNVCGSMPDNDYATLYAPNMGCMARISAELNEQAVGTIQVKAYSTQGYYSLFYVYVSTDDSNWEFIDSLVISSSTPTWYNIGVHTESFRYILLTGYDSGNSVHLNIDAVNIDP